MKKSHLVLAIATLFSANTFANNIHLSPEVKIGPYGGFGIQAGVTGSEVVTGVSESVLAEVIEQCKA